jgi:superfamily II DNA or RNA helicase
MAVETTVVRTAVAGMTVAGSRQARPYQLAALDAIEHALARDRSTLLVLPTGCGKTFVFSEVARRFVASGRRVLVVAHRFELLEQARRALGAVGVVAQLEQGKHRAGADARCVVASIDTLRGSRLLQYPSDHFGLVIVDEAHHAVAPKYQLPLRHFRHAQVLGVTATADRLDGVGLGKVFASVAYSYEMGAAIADGYLVPLEFRRVAIDRLDLDDVSTRAGDYDRVQLSRAMRDPAVLDECCRWLLERVGRRRTIVFCVDRQHASDVAAALNRARPSTALAADGNLSAEERKSTLERWRGGEVNVLVNCDLYTEGFDEQSVEVVVLMRPTQSRSLYTQMVGRGARLYGSTLAESIANGKASCEVLDLVGNSRRHRLVGPADALLGSADASAELRAELARLLEAGGAAATRDLDATLAQARQNLAGDAQRQAAAAVLAFRERLVDPFLAPYYDQLPGLVVGRPASPQQLAALAKLGIDKPPSALSADEATRWIRGAHARRRKGLCTIRQALFLGRWGLDCSAMTMDRATALYLEFKGLGPSAFRVHAMRQPEWTAKPGGAAEKPRRPPKPRSDDYADDDPAPPHPSTLRMPDALDFQRYEAWMERNK